MRPKKKILIVDANEQRAGVLKFALETNHFDARVCSTAAEAVEQAETWCAELAILGWPQRDLDVRRVLHGVAMRFPLGNVRTLVVADSLEPAMPDLRAHRTMCAPTMDAVLEACRYLTARKRGPRKGWQPLPPASVVPAAIAERISA